LERLDPFRRINMLPLLRALSLLLLIPVPLLAADNPFTGTWKLNVTRSRLLPGDTTRSDVYHAIADESTIKISERVTDDKGVHRITVEAKIDGKDYPVIGDPMSNLVSYRRVSANRMEVTTKKGLHVTAKASAAVSEDRKTIVVNFTVYSQDDAKSGTAVYEKQPD
jgi:hypothetical protein